MEQFANRSTTTLSAGINNVTATIPVVDFTTFPGSTPFRIIIDSEVMLVTAGAGSNTWTAIRGYEGTSAVSHASGAIVKHTLTAGGLIGFQRDLLTFNVDDFGVVGDGVTNDSAAISAAIAAMPSTGATLYFPPGFNCLIDSTITITNSQLRLVGGAGAKFTASSAPSFNKITLWDLAEVTGFIFDRVRLVVEFSFPDTSGLRIHHNIFRNPNTGYAILCDTNGSVWPSAITITENLFDNHLYGVSGAVSNSVISKNRFINGTSRNIELWAGSNNTISDNYIESGVTGIIFLTRRSVTGRFSFYDNVITGNTIQGISEEAISLDGSGFDASDGAYLNTGTIASGITTDANGYLQFVPSFTIPAGGYAGASVIMTSGKAKGQSLLIRDPSTAHLIVQTKDVGDFTVGDNCIVSLVQNRTIISNNTISGLGAGQTGISLWGSCCENVISNNTIDDHTLYGIKLASLYNGSGQSEPCMNNIVTGNIVRNSSIEIRTGLSGTTDYKSLGNTCYGNTLVNSNLKYEFQEGFQCWDNTMTGGGTQTIDNTGVPLPPINIVRTADFESGTVSTNFDSVTDTGTRLSLDATVHFHGAQSLKMISGSNASYGQVNIAAGNRKVVVGFPFYLDAFPASTVAMFKFIGGSITIETDVTSAGLLQNFVGGTAGNPSFTFSTGVWYWMDCLADTSTTTYSYTMQVTRVSDGVIVAAPGALTAAGTAADMTSVRFGTGGTNTLALHFDDYTVTTSTTNYPIGIPTFSTYTPVADGTWLPQQKMYNPRLANGDPVGWTCITGGRPGIWQPTGDVNGGAQSAAPTTGYWPVGAKVYNSAPQAGGNAGWICVTAGIPGTWKPFGAIGI